MDSGQLSAIELRDSNSQLISQRRKALTPAEDAELEQVLQQARSENSVNDAIADSKDFDAVKVRLPDGQTLIVSTLRRGGTDLGQTISGSQSEYQKLVERQRRVRWLGLSTLGLMTLMMLFVSSWVAIYLARGIATPIKALAEASNEVARGNLSHRVDAIAEDELAMLAHSFNQMTAQLEDNRRSIEAGSAALLEKNQTLEERRKDRKSVVQSLSTGVVSVDENDRVTTLNRSAARMLGLVA